MVQVCNMHVKCFKKYQTRTNVKILNSEVIFIRVCVTNRFIVMDLYLQHIFHYQQKSPIKEFLGISII